MHEDKISSGWIKLYRSLLDWEWYDDHSTTRLWIHLLLKANHTPKKWRGIKIERGQILCSESTLEIQTGLTRQMIRTSLKNLEKSKNLTRRLTNLGGQKYTVLELHNYDDFQAANQWVNQRLTNEQPMGNQWVTTTNNINNEKECESVDARAREISQTQKASSFENITDLILTTDEKKELLRTYGIHAQAYKKKLINHINSIGRDPYHSHAATLKKWLDKDLQAEIIKLDWRDFKPQFFDNKEDFEAIINRLDT